MSCFLVLLIVHTLTGDDDDVRQWMHLPSLNRVADFAACTKANTHNHTYIDLWTFHCACPCYLPVIHCPSLDCAALVFRIRSLWVGPLSLSLSILTVDSFANLGPWSNRERERETEWASDERTTYTIYAYDDYQWICIHVVPTKFTVHSANKVITARWLGSVRKRVSEWVNEWIWRIEWVDKKGVNELVGQ